jgi:hypothetical protein
MADLTALFHQYEQDYCNKSTEISRKISSLTGVPTGGACRGTGAPRAAQLLTPLPLPAPPRPHPDVRRSKASEIEASIREAEGVVRGRGGAGWRRGGGACGAWRARLPACAPARVRMRPPQGRRPAAGQLRVRGVKRGPAAAGRRRRGGAAAPHAAQAPWARSAPLGAGATASASPTSPATRPPPPPPDQEPRHGGAQPAG